MKTFVLLFFIIIGEISLNAQKIFPSITDNPKWLVCRQLSTYPIRRIYDTISFEKDTTISQRIYHKFISRDSLIIHLTGYVRISGEKVFLFKSGKDYLLYDFSLKSGDSVFCGYNLTTSNPDTIKMRVIQIDSVEYNSIKHKRITLSYNPFSDYFPQIVWIEGIGSSIHPFYSLISLNNPGSILKLISLKENNVIIFQSDLDTSVNSPTKNELIVYPNPFSEYVIFQNISNGEPIHVYLLDLKGNILIDKIFFSNFINLSQIKKGIYLINVKTTTNTINLYEKIIKF